MYVHPPRQTHHIIPSEKGDQLCHAVIKPRHIKPMRASKYCITFQMSEQTGSFQGIDTCDATSFGDFSYCSTLLDESESRSIKYRADINSLLDQYEIDGYLSSTTVKAMRERAMGSGPSEAKWRIVCLDQHMCHWKMHCYYNIKLEKIKASKSLLVMQVVITKELFM